MGMESYRTISGSAEAFYEIQKSRFITHVLHVTSEEEARAFVQQMKKKYFDARHNCSAWVLGERGDQQKSNDDGEPGGTAGNPILENIKKKGLTDVAVVVTRYFGGIKLGAGGLIRAYGHSAGLGLEAAEIVVMTPLRRIRLTLEYDLLAPVEHWIRKKDIRTEAPSYAEQVELTVLMAPGEAEERLTELADITAGRCQTEIQGEALIAVPEEKEQEKG